MKKRDLELLYEIGSLRHIPRGWTQHLGVRCATDLEHTMRVIFTALILARMEKVKNEEKIIKMALVHDLAETRTADHSYVQKVYVTIDEKSAIHDTLQGTILSDFEEIIDEYEERKCIEAKIVKDADNLDIDIELKEFDEQGHKLPKKWINERKLIRNKKLYTKSAKKLWDEIQKSSPASWHIESNKWRKIPSAGK